jgi:predicted alpha/beta hydrolase family esterase
MICDSPCQILADAHHERLHQQQFLWIGTNPSLHCFHGRLQSLLNQEFPLKQWEYSQTPDEPGSLDVALELLHDYVMTSSAPCHLIGHGQGGVLALSYAHRYPERVASVVLLSVAAQPVITWQSYYYEHLAYLNCDRHQVLKIVASRISQIPCPRYICHLADRLDRDLLEAPSSHSLLRHDTPLKQGVLGVPLLVYGASDDPVMAGSIFTDWSHGLKLGDRLHLAPQGGHFFHYQYAESVGQKIGDFWRQLPEYPLPCLIPQALQN